MFAAAAATLSILVQGSLVQGAGRGAGADSFMPLRGGRGEGEEFISVGRARYLRATYVRVPNSPVALVGSLRGVVTNSKRRVPEESGARREGGREVVRGG